ncbi:MAG: hypothetical protein Q9160_005058 [Pyrenula sp. 1 TL-2023]
MSNESRASGGNKASTPARLRGTVGIQSSESQERSGGRDALQENNDRLEKTDPRMGDTTFSQIGMGELLDQEERPIFIVDVGDSANYGPGPLRIVYANSALCVQKDIIDLVHGKSETSSHSLGSTSSYAEFKGWATSFVKDSQALSVTLPSFVYGDITWICSSTIRKRLRIINGQSDPIRSIGVAHARDVSSAPETNMPTTVSGNALPGSHLASNVQTLTSRLDFSVQQSTVRPRIQRAESSHTANLRAHRLSGKRYSGSHTNDGIDSSNIPFPSVQLGNEAILGIASAADVDAFESGFSSGGYEGFFDWTRLPMSPSLPPHIQFARNIDWQSTPLGPIEEWPSDLRGIPHPAAMYWGDDLTAIYNESYVMLAGQKHPELMGMSYKEAWSEIWDAVKDVFAAAVTNAQATMKDDDRLFLRRAGFLEETYFSWSIIPLIGEDGTVIGLYNPAFEKTRRKIAERRMLTLREIGETTAAARELSEFWQQVLKGFKDNEFDAPFLLVYSMSDESDSDAASVQSSSGTLTRYCNLEGSLGIPEGHPAAPLQIDIKTGTSGFANAFRQAKKGDRPILLKDDEGTLDPNLLDNIKWRGFGDRCRSVVVCPIHPTTSESTLGFLVMGTNPRRPYDEDYDLFVQLLGRQLATSVASVVLYEDEIKRGEKAAKLAAQDRIELSNQLAIRTQEATESKIQFARMAELAPVGMFIADSQGKITFCNQNWYEISNYARDTVVGDDWIEQVNEVDRPGLVRSWSALIERRVAMSAEFRFKKPWTDSKGNTGDTWVLMNAWPEKYPDGTLKSVFGSVTDISSQKFAEGLNKKRMEEAVELKRQQQNYIDTTSHEIRNPLSAILQCADEVSNTLEHVKNINSLTEDLTATVDSALDAAQTITLCAQHQKRIVDDVLTLSKLDSKMLMVTPVDVQPVSVVQRALKMFEGELQNADIQLQFEVDQSFRALEVEWVRIDPSRLLQVLINLTTNAIKFTNNQEKRNITVQLAASLTRPSESHQPHVSYIPTRSDGRDVTVEADWGTGDRIYLYFAVKDTGRGLTESEKKLLFLRFSQGSPRTHVAYGGSGLGLFISRELVEMQGGEIGVSSESGKGSTFAFYIIAKRSKAPKDWVDESILPSSRKGSGAKLPRYHSKTPPGLTQSSTGTDRSAPSSPQQKSSEALRILIVEDNLVNQKVLAKQLTKMGCITAVANHGGEAIEKLQQSTYWRGQERTGQELGLILMDIEMPVMDGLTAAKKIRELQDQGLIVKHVPIMAVTANARAEQISVAKEAGMDDVVSKPFRIPELMPKMRQMNEMVKRIGR